MKDSSKRVMTLFYVLIVLFILNVINISPLGQGIRDIFESIFSSEIISVVFRMSIFVLGGAFMIIGILLTILAKKQVKNKKLKRFLMTSGISAGSFLILAILHNVFYGIAKVFQDNKIVSWVMTSLDVISFLTAVCVVPIVFMIGVIGSIIVQKRSKK